MDLNDKLDGKGDAPDLWPGPACLSCNHTFYFSDDGMMTCAMCGDLSPLEYKRHGQHDFTAH